MTPRTDNANRQIREERRRQILDAALKVFAIKGLAAAKISDIAAEAELSHGLIYHYFKSKDEIFTELVKEALDISINAYQHADKITGSPLEKITKMTERVLKHAYCGRGVNYFLLMIEAATSDSVPAEAKEYMIARKGMNRKQLLPLIIEGQQAGEIVDDSPERLASVYFAMIKGLALDYAHLDLEKEFPTAETVNNLFKKK